MIGLKIELYKLYVWSHGAPVVSLWREIFRQENSLDRLFYPKSVAIIGVSEKPDNLAGNIVRNLMEFQFRGKVFLVGTNEGAFCGKTIHASMDRLPNKIDLAVILTPAPTIPGILESCGRKGIHWVIVESGGFSEYSEQGEALERKIHQIARRWRIRICGPNCVGVINVENGFVVPFVIMNSRNVRKGNVSIVAQSGGVSYIYLNLLAGGNVGIGKIISMGNKLDLDETDYLRYLIKDPRTHIIGLYLESFEKGREMIEITRSSPKPIIIHKANTGNASRHIAKLHTAALANDDQVVEAALKQAAVVRTKNFRSFSNVVKIFSLPPMKGRNLVVLSRSGGIAIIAADAAEKCGFDLFPLPKHFQERVYGYFRAKVIQPINPLDLGDLFDFDLYVRIIEQVLKIKAVDGVLFQHGAGGPDEKELSRALISAVKELSSRYEKPVALCYITDDEELAIVKRTVDYPIFAEPEDALSAMAISLNHYDRSKKPRERIPHYRVERTAARHLLQKARREKRDLLLPEAFEVLRAYGIRVAQYRMAHRISDLKETLNAIGPLALKVVSPEISHKSDAGGVFLNVNDLPGAEAAYKKMSKLTSGKLSGILAQEMISSGKEVIVGAKRDPSFGPVLLFGLGGIYVEVLNEHSLRVAPITRSEATEMISELKASEIFRGIRGEGSLDLDAVADNLLRLSQLMMDFPEIEGVDINPVKVLQRDAVAVDARIVITPD